MEEKENKRQYCCIIPDSDAPKEILPQWARGLLTSVGLGLVLAGTRFGWCGLVAWLMLAALLLVETFERMREKEYLQDLQECIEHNRRELLRMFVEGECDFETKQEGKDNGATDNDASEQGVH